MNIGRLAPIVAVGAVGLVVVSSALPGGFGERSSADDLVELTRRLSEVMPYDHDLGGYFVQKWTGPINIRFVSDRRHRRFELGLRDLSDRFSVLTGLPVRVVEEGREANVLVEIASRPRFEAMLRKLEYPARETDFCLTTTGANRDFEIDTGVIVLPDWVRSKFLKGCLEHEMLHLVGLAEHLVVDDTALTEYWDGGRITKTDERLVSLLYSPCINPGMRRHWAVQAAFKVFAGECSGN